MSAEFQTKQCRNCGTVKPVSQFYKRAGNTDGLSNACKACDSAYSRAYSRRTYKHKEVKVECPPGKKYCPACKQIKEHSEFYKDSQNKDGLTYDCKDCSKIYAHNYNSKNLEKVRSYHQKYFQTHREDFRESTRKWATLHPEKLREINKRARDKLRAKKKLAIEQAWEKRLGLWKVED